MDTIMQVSKVATVFLNLLVVALADNYLILFPPEAGSHTGALTAAASAMIERNHMVTLIAPSEFTDNLKKRMRTDNYILESYRSSVTLDLFRDFQTEVAGHAIKGEYYQLIKISNQIQPKLIIQSCDDLFADRQLLTRLTQQKFDLILTLCISLWHVLYSWLSI